MTDTTEDLEPQPPQGDVKVVYLGPIAPHWEVHSTFGERDLIDSFRDRISSRLLLLPPHDPQFRRNRERINRDCLLYTSPSPRDRTRSRMPSSA